MQSTGRNGLPPAHRPFSRVDPGRLNAPHEIGGAIGGCLEDADQKLISRVIRPGCGAAAHRRDPKPSPAVTVCAQPVIAFTP